MPRGRPRKHPVPTPRARRKRATSVEWLTTIAWKAIDWEPAPRHDKRVPYSVWSALN